MVSRSLCCNRDKELAVLFGHNKLAFHVSGFGSNIRVSVMISLVGKIICTFVFINGDL